MNLPPDTDLPFFSYGIFKPGQLGFFQIKDFIEKWNQSECMASLYERDGVPLLDLSYPYRHIKGYLIYFNEGQEKEAYSQIASMEPEKQYGWNTLKFENNKLANVLEGKDIHKGSIHCEYTNWDGRYDPLFKEAFVVIDEILNLKPKELKLRLDFSETIYNLFYLQMAYMLLWSAIERYATLKYGLKLKPGQKILKISEEQAFKDGLKKYVTNKNRSVSCSIRPDEEEKLDSDNPKKSIEYYYKIRSNTTHRGKTVPKDEVIIRTSLLELKKIFKDMLDESFKFEIDEL